MIARAKYIKPLLVMLTVLTIVFAAIYVSGKAKLAKVQLEEVVQSSLFSDTELIAFRSSSQFAADVFAEYQVAVPSVRNPAGMIGVIGDITNVKKSVSQKPLIIGENVHRTEEYAGKIGGHAWQPQKNAVSTLMERNERMIKDTKKVVGKLLI